MIDESSMFVGGVTYSAVEVSWSAAPVDIAEGDDLDAIDRLSGVHRYEATATLTLDRAEWERFKRALTPRTLHLGRLGGRRAVAIDRVRYPRPKFKMVRRQA